MKIEQVYVVVPETYREQNMLREMVGVGLSPELRTVGTDGEEFMRGTFHVTDNQLSKIRGELRKLDELRLTELRNEVQELQERLKSVD